MNLQVTQPLPAELHGFRVEIGVGPYPPDRATSDREAVYAKLYPVSDLMRERMAYMGRTMILGTLPIAPEMSALIANGDDEATEFAAYAALQAAAHLVAEVRE